MLTTFIELPYIVESVALATTVDVHPKHFAAPARFLFNFISVTPYLPTVTNYILEQRKVFIKVREHFWNSHTT